MVRSDLTIEELAYLAGFFDGEGCVLASPYKYQARDGLRIYYQVHAEVGQNTPEVLYAYRSAFGGDVYPRRSSYGTSFMYRAAGQDAKACLAALLPYLRIKHEQAELALMLADLVGTPKARKMWSLEQQQMQAELAAKIKALKHVRQG